MQTAVSIAQHRTQQKEDCISYSAKLHKHMKTQSHPSPAYSTTDILDRISNAIPYFILLQFYVIFQKS